MFNLGQTIRQSRRRFLYVFYIYVFYIGSLHGGVANSGRDIPAAMAPLLVGRCAASAILPIGRRGLDSLLNQTLPGGFSDAAPDLTGALFDLVERLVGVGKLLSSCLRDWRTSSSIWASRSGSVDVAGPKWKDTAQIDNKTRLPSICVAPFTARSAGIITITARFSLKVK